MALNQETQNSLIEIAKSVKWTNQRMLTKKEDEIVKEKKYLLFSQASFESNEVKRYLALGSIPYIVDAQPSFSLEEIWPTEWPMQKEIDGLVRRPTVPTGNLKPDFFLIGDAPGVGDGALYSRFDRVFVYGQSSHILRKALLANGLYYQCFFTNLLKLSTPNNRPSLSSEVELHKQYLMKEIDLMKPKGIIILGKHVQEMFKAHYFTADNAPHDIEVRLAYHPSYMNKTGKTPQEYAKQLERLMKGII
ncbi:MAG TPA: uracil-DNA glycosylase family protein [Cyclobacteriaceae bacterium]|jgi:DNA polymerase|nr:uracil-DNA glycosylase family protein [Cyclobacteriaceae bacterium]